MTAEERAGLMGGNAARFYKLQGGTLCQQYKQTD